MNKRWILILSLVVASMGMMIYYLKASKPVVREDFDIAAFGKLPIQAGGRVKPMDSFARNALLMIRAKQAFVETQGSDKVRRPAIELLLEASLRMEKAESYPLFRIDHEQVLGLIGKSQADGKEFPLEEIKPHMSSIQQRLMAAGQKPEEDRDDYDKALARFANALQSYMSISSALPTPLFTDSAHSEIDAYDGLLAAGIEANEKRSSGEPYDQATLERLETFVKVYNNQLNDPRTSGALHTIPPILEPTDPDAFIKDRDPSDKADAEKIVDDIHTSDLPYRDKVETAMALAQRASSSRGAHGIYEDYVERWKAMIPWQSPVESLLASVETGKVDPLVKAYAAMADAYTSGDAKAFNRGVEDAHEILEGRVPHFVDLAVTEVRMNTFKPFLRSMILYVCAFLIAAVSWMVATRPLATAALIVMTVAMGIHAYGLYARMVIMDRPWVWVTNLYSSAVFIGFTAVLLCIILEYFFRRGIAAACGTIIGFGTLVVAHHLSLEGDTLAPLEAVLDTNFWLSTHVTTVTIGYAATFLAGFLAIFFIGYGLFRRNIPTETAKLFSGMVYGIICFALLFSLIGTLLGGIWADQSWGRFWGWDPKENGALMIVLWNALILHARWGKVTGMWGIMCLAVFGNVITSWSWFGTNLLGIGLHSYGFNSSTAMFLLGFLVFNLIFIVAGMIKMLTKPPRTDKPHPPKGQMVSASST